MARIPINCGCEDFPCCGCDEVMLTGEDALEAMRDDEACEDEGYDREPFESHDLSDDGDALASAGFGTDEDYHQCEGYDNGEW